MNFIRKNFDFCCLNSLLEVDSTSSKNTDCNSGCNSSFWQVYVQLDIEGVLSFLSTSQTFGLAIRQAIFALTNI